METSEKVSIFAGLNVKGGIPSPLHNPPMRVDTLSWDFVYSLTGRQSRPVHSFEKPQKSAIAGDRARTMDPSASPRSLEMTRFEVCRNAEALQNRSAGPFLCLSIYTILFPLLSVCLHNFVFTVYGLPFPFSSGSFPLSSMSALDRQRPDPEPCVSRRRFVPLRRGRRPRPAVAPSRV